MPQQNMYSIHTSQKNLWYLTCPHQSAGAKCPKNCTQRLERPKRLRGAFHNAIALSKSPKALRNQNESGSAQQSVVCLLATGNWFWYLVFLNSSPCHHLPHLLAPSPPYSPCKKRRLCRRYRFGHLESICIVTPLLLTPLLAVILAALNAAVLADGGALQKLDWTE